MLNYNFILQKAKDSQIDSITIEREYWQLLWLQRMYLSPFSSQIHFKGGTAIRFLFQSFRFSEDLDFTAKLSQKKCRSAISEIFEFFKKNSAADVDLKDEPVGPHFKDVSLKFRFLFKPKNITQKVSIRIDISLREKPLTSEKTIITPFDYPISPYPLVVHLAAEELLAEKVRALFVRGKPRDLFDLWYLLTKNITLNTKFIEIKFQLYPGLVFSHKRLMAIIQGYDEKELKKDLNQFLPLPYRSFYRDLKPELLKLLPKHNFKNTFGL